MDVSRDMVQEKFARTPVVEMRKAARYPMAGTVRIGWVDEQRQMTYVTARGLDISETGLAARVPAELHPSALVHLDLAGCGMSAVGRVRYCERQGAEWR